MNSGGTRGVSNHEGNQKALVIAGWHPGFKKVEFTKMLQCELGYSLRTAKSVTDQVLTGCRVELPVLDSNHDYISGLTGALGAIVVSQNEIPNVMESLCQ